MRIRTIFAVAGCLAVGIPCVVLGVDASVRWRPAENSGIVTRVAASTDLDAYLKAREDSVLGVRPGLRKTIVWRDSARRSRTPLALVYLHGYSASRGEIAPVIERLADSLGANAYFTRFAAHGRVDGEQFASVTPQEWINDAREALAVGRRIGERTILVGTSTGGTLAMLMAAESDDVAAPAVLVLISPNHQPADWRSGFVVGPFGPMIARLAGGRYQGSTTVAGAEAEVWTPQHRSEGIAALMDLVRYARGVDVSRVTIPLLTLYSSHDDVVRLDLVRSRHAEFGSRPKQIIDVVEAPGHVLAGSVKAPSAVNPVVGHILRFVREAGLVGDNTNAAHSDR